MDVEEEGLPGGDTKEPSGREEERERERREKKDGARMGKRILFLVGGSSEYLPPCLYLSPSSSLSFVSTSSMSSLFTSTTSDRRDISDTCDRLIL